MVYDCLWVGGGVGGWGVDGGAGGGWWLGLGG